MDKAKAIYTIQGLKTVYDEYSEAFQMALDLLNDQVTIIDSEKAVLTEQLTNANTTVSDLNLELETKVNELNGKLFDANAQIADLTSQLAK